MDLLKSALTTKGTISISDSLEWLKKRRDLINVEITKISFDELIGWGFQEDTKNLVHDSGRFFSIEGIQVNTNWGPKHKWSQPIINQPEIGILGILAKSINGVLHFLMQAKIEPGNINYVQLSPTLQATKSNYTRVHKGKAPRYLDYFIEKKGKVLLDQLQSEQGARFLKKRNRNIILEIKDDIDVHEDFCWLTLGQIKSLLKYDNIVNMDTRTVISGISYGALGSSTVGMLDALSPLFCNSSNFETGMLASELDQVGQLHNIDFIISWFTELKSHYELSVEKIPLNYLDDWVISENDIHHKEHKYFKVIPVRAQISNREVVAWTQPLVESAQEGIIAFITKKINGVYHFLVQAKLEAGNHDILEMAPTVQCLTGNYRGAQEKNRPAYLNYVLEKVSKKEGIRYCTHQSEEGGRFYREQNQSIIIEAEESFDVKVPDNFIWMTLNQMKIFIKFNNYLNIQARSLLSSINYIKSDET